MNLKILAIVTGVMILLTILLFVFTSSSSQNGPSSSPTPGAASLSPLPTVDQSLPPTKGKAKITGLVCTPDSTTSLPGLMVVAEQIPSRLRTTQYVPGPFEEDVSFSLEVDPGTYQVYTETPNRTKIGLYSHYITCGSDPNLCPDHTLVEVLAQADDILTDINVCDYQWTQPIPSPTQQPAISPIF